jgi:hypothetical protein
VKKAVETVISSLKIDMMGEGGEVEGGGGRREGGGEAFFAPHPRSLPQPPPLGCSSTTRPLMHFAGVAPPQHCTTLTRSSSANTGDERLDSGGRVSANALGTPPTLTCCWGCSCFISSFDLFPDAQHAQRGFDQSVEHRTHGFLPCRSAAWRSTRVSAP